MDKQCPSCGGNCGRTIKSGCMYDIPVERKSRETLLQIQAAQIAKLTEQIGMLERRIARELK
jgi:hypothetical protein